MDLSEEKQQNNIPTILLFIFAMILIILCVNIFYLATTDNDKEFTPDILIITDSSTQKHSPITSDTQSVSQNIPLT